jgi:hypothetical protein
MSLRGKLSDDFVRALADDWREHGAAVLEKVREKNPSRYAQLIADLVPREMIVNETPGPLDHIRTKQELRPHMVQIIIDEGWAGDVLKALGYEPPAAITQRTASQEN